MIKISKASITATNMVLEVILREIKNYKEFITTTEYDELYKWEALKNFQDNWNIEADDFQTMFDRSLHSNYTGNLWANPHWFPKAVMLEFIKYDKERVRKMFQDLYDESVDIDKRIERFIFNCDKLLEEVYALDKRVKNHFHDGLRIVSLYLAFKYPEKYAIYKFTEFKTFMELVRAKDIPKTGEHERFFKIVRTVYNILVKDNELMQIHKAVLKDDCYQGPTLMLAQDFIFTTARRYIS